MYQPVHFLLQHILWRSICPPFKVKQLIRLFWHCNKSNFCWKKWLSVLCQETQITLSRKDRVTFINKWLWFYYSSVSYAPCTCNVHTLSYLSSPCHWLWWLIPQIQTILMWWEWHSILQDFCANMYLLTVWRLVFNINVAPLQNSKKQTLPNNGRGKHKNSASG